MTLLRSLTVALSAVAAVALTPLPAQAVVDDTPAPSASFNGTVRAVATYGSTTFVAGDFTRASDSRGTFVRRHLAAVNTRTGRLLPWHPRTNGAVYAIAAYRGRVYIGGAFTVVNGRRRARVAKLSVRTGARDGTFRAVTNAPVRAIALTSTRLYLGGDFTRAQGRPRGHLAAYTRRTSRLLAWHPRANGRVYDVAVRHGLLWVGGAFTAINGNASARRIAALRQGTGTVSASFRMRGAPVVRALQVTGTRVYVGAAGSGGHLYVRTRSGSPLWSKTFDGDVNAIALLNNVVYVGGHWHYICSNKPSTDPQGDCVDDAALVPRLAAFNGSGTLQSWVPRPDSALGVLAMTTSAASDTLAIGGGFTAFNKGAIRQPAFAIFR
jgi:hypothetical protein